MRKIIIYTMLLSSLAFSKTFDFLKQKFNAEVIESSVINNKKKKKVYNLEYSPSALKLEVVEPKLNKGEVITYFTGKKTLYSPKLKQTVEQKLSKEDASLYSILEELSKLDSNITYEKNNKKYIFENQMLVEIIADKYSIKFTEYIGKKPKKIQYLSNSVTIDYTINY